MEVVVFMAYVSFP